MPKKRKDGRYAKQVTIDYKDGKPIKKTMYGKTIKELDKKYRDFMSLKDKGIIIEEENLKFRELSKLYLVNEKKDSVKPQTYRNYVSRIGITNLYIGDIIAMRLKKSHIEEMRRGMIELEHYDQYNKALGDIRAIIHYGISSDLMFRDITVGMKRIKYKAKSKRVLSIDERNLMNKANFTPFEKCYTSLLLYSGIRRGEALALNIADIDFTNLSIKISKTLVASEPVESCLQELPKTDAGNRTIPIVSALYSTLKEFSKDKSGILFRSEYGGYYSSSAFVKRWNAIIDKMTIANNGITVSDDITSHIFRHTYASDLYKAGVDIKQAQYLLGHSDIKTTLDIYTHFGYVDVDTSKMEKYYETVNRQSGEKIIPLKLA